MKRNERSVLNLLIWKCMFFVLFCNMSIVLYAQIKPETFTLMGDLTRASHPARMVIYNYRYQGEGQTDTSIVRDGKYTISGLIDEPQMIQLDVVYIDPIHKTGFANDYLTVHVAPGTSATVVHKKIFSEVTVTGSAAQDEFNKVLPKLGSEGTGFIPQYLKDHPNTAIAFILIQHYLGADTDPDVAEPLYDALSPANQGTPSGKRFIALITAIRKNTIGNPAPDISVNDPNGKVIRLSNFRGKYVLVEFWASWCSPCRAENPNLVNAYNTYRERGFEILGVSGDISRKSWLAAIEKDKLGWTNVSELKLPAESNIARAFGVNALPSNFLIDPKGVIISKNLRGKQLQEKLAELFK